MLLLACLNVANLSLARAYARRSETALRLAVGASRGRIVREVLVQSAILACLGALVGMAAAPLVTTGLISFLPDAVDLSPAVNPRVFAFALLVAVGTGLLFGLVPALHASRTPPGYSLKESSRTLAGGLALRKALVAGQIGLALVLLVGAGLFVRTLSNLRSRGPGFATTNLLGFYVDPARSGYDEPQSRALLRRLVEAVRALPEVQSAALSASDLLGPGSWNTRLTVDAEGRRFVAEDVVHCNAVDPSFFETLGVAMVAGRSFDDRDVAVDPKRGFRSAIVNERFARRYFADRSPIGARMAFGAAPNVVTDIEVVGVVRTFSRRARGLRDPEEQAFFPFFEMTRAGGAMVYVRTRIPVRRGLRLDAGGGAEHRPRPAHRRAAHARRPARPRAPERKAPGHPRHRLRLPRDPARRRRPLRRHFFRGHPPHPRDRDPHGPRGHAAKRRLARRARHRPHGRRRRLRSASPWSGPWAAWSRASSSASEPRTRPRSPSPSPSSPPPP